MAIYLLIIIIALLLLIIIRIWYNQNTELDQNYTNIVYKDSFSFPAATQETLSYWESWKKDNPSKASTIVALTGKDFSNSSDADARQIIDSFRRFTDANNISDWNSIKPLIISKFKEMIKDIGEEQSRKVVNDLVDEDVKRSGHKVENTLSYYAQKWFLSYLNEEKKSEKIEGNILSPEEKLKKDFQEIVKSKVGSSFGISLFCSGYDSPVAHEIISLMYSYLRNPELKLNAEKVGLGNKYIRLIADETESILDKYCCASLQQCIEYYNFPNRPVITSDRCPSCNSKIILDNYEEGFECMECGRIWRAPLGRRLYL